MAEPAKIKLTWDYDGVIGEGFHIYRSESPMDAGNLPEPIATVGIGIREYIDSDGIVEDETYFYRIASYLGTVLSVSEELEFFAEDVISDPYWANVVSLLNFETGFNDATGKIWIPNGSPTIDTLDSKFGDNSVIKSGSGDLYTSSGVDFQFPGDFTIEAWIKTDPDSRNTMLIGYSTSRNELLPLYLDSAGSGRVFWKGSNAITGLVLPIGTWFHYALTRNNNALRAFVNGNQQGGTVSRIGTVGVTSGLIYILGDRGTYQNWRGRLDELRITKGVARYVSNFTPPSNPFPNK